MRVIPFSDSAVAEAILILKNGGVIAHATETCYGLACDLSNPDAVQKLFAIKQRPESQPVSALFPSIDEAKRYVEWNDRAEELAQQYLPGPLTMILHRRKNAPAILHIVPPPPSARPDEHPFGRGEGLGAGEMGIGIGIRISSHPAAQSLIAAFGSPLSTTSANLHGQPNPYSPDDIATQFAAHDPTPDLVLDSGTLPQNPPSTVIDLTGGDHVHRQGSIAV